MMHFETCLYEGIPFELGLPFRKEYESYHLLNRILKEIEVLGNVHNGINRNMKENVKECDRCVYAFLYVCGFGIYLYKR
jgi:hypothetical protein